MVQTLKDKLIYKTNRSDVIIYIFQVKNRYEEKEASASI